MFALNSGQQMAIVIEPRTKLLEVLYIIMAIVGQGVTALQMCTDSLC